MSTLFAIADETTMRATLTKIRWQENGRIIAEVRDGTRRVSVLGDMIDPKIGEEYEFTGELGFNDRYKSHEFKFTTYRTILPSSADGIMRYLIDVARWVGPTTAKAIVDAFGTDALAVIRDTPERLAGIPNLTAERIREMQQTLRDNAANEAAAIELNQIIGGTMGPATVRKSLRKWGADAAHVIKADPFTLMSLPGVGFVSADAVRRRMGIGDHDIRRHIAAVLWAITEIAAREGHTRILEARMMAELRKLVGDPHPDTFAECRRLGIFEEDLDSDGLTAGVCPADLSRAESYIASKIVSMLSGQDDDKRVWAPIDPTGLAPDQIAAAEAFANAAVFILCGAPGTGKTYTLARIVRSMIVGGASVGLCAPTGKAAKQMSLALADVCPTPASTIHSILGPVVDEETGEFSFEYGPNNPLPYDLLIVDEFSMVDARLANSLLGAIKPDARLLIVGDHYQLPSVGPGAVLRDLLAAGVPHHELTQIKRNAGRIVMACHLIKDGRVPEPCPRLDLAAGDNWRHIDAGSPEEIKEIVRQLLTDKLPPDIDRRWGAQLISPTNETGELSCDALNLLAKELLNPGGIGIEKTPFAIGDKVVRTKNGIADGRYAEAADEHQASEGGVDLGTVRIVNGDIGLIVDAGEKTITVRFRFPERVVTLKRNDHLCKLAYCLTCHKMQGSEVPVVILPLHRSLAKLPMWTREWIYTAISRGKSFIVTVGDLAALSPGIRRVGTHQRQTKLAHLVQKLRGLARESSMAANVQPVRNQEAH